MTAVIDRAYEMPGTLYRPDFGPTQVRDRREITVGKTYIKHNRFVHNGQLITTRIKVIKAPYSLDIDRIEAPWAVDTELVDIPDSASHLPKRTLIIFLCDYNVRPYVNPDVPFYSELSIRNRRWNYHNWLEDPTLPLISEYEYRGFDKAGNRLSGEALKEAFHPVGG